MFTMTTLDLTTVGMRRSATAAACQLSALRLPRLWDWRAAAPPPGGMVRCSKVGSQCETAMGGQQPGAVEGGSRAFAIPSLPFPALGGTDK